MSLKMKKTSDFPWRLAEERAPTQCHTDGLFTKNVWNITTKSHTQRQHTAWNCYGSLDIYLFQSLSFSRIQMVSYISCMLHIQLFHYTANILVIHYKPFYTIRSSYTLQTFLYDTFQCICISMSGLSIIGQQVYIPHDIFIRMFEACPSLIL